MLFRVRDRPLFLTTLVKTPKSSAAVGKTSESPADNCEYLGIFEYLGISGSASTKTGCHQDRLCKEGPRHRAKLSRLMRPGRLSQGLP